MNIKRILCKQTVDFKCNNCGFLLSVCLEEMWLEERLICRGCKYFIQLNDYEGTVQKTIRDINQSVRDINTTLSKTISIKL